MRKYLLTVVLLTVAIYGIAQSQSVYVEIGAFKSAGTTKTAHAYLSPDSSTFYGYVIPAEFTSPFKLDNPVVNIFYTDSLMTQLKRVSAKYREWTNLSKENTIGQFSKYIPIDLPINFAFDLKYSSGKVETYTQEPSKKQFKFNLYNPAKNPSIFIDTIFESCRVKYHIVLAFLNPDEFDAFIDFLSPEKVIARVKKGCTVDDIFK